MTDAIDFLQRQLNEARAEIARLRAEIERLRKQIERLEDEVMETGRDF